MPTQSIKKLVTHDGKFHADDIFACAVLAILLKKQGYTVEVIRTRDEALIAAGDFVFDVGGIYDPAQNRFDHHQKGGAGERENGIPYAAIGLVWKTYGAELCDGDIELANQIDKFLIQPIDANDNGMELSTPTRDDVRSVFLQDALYAFRATWKEDASTYDAAFLELVSFAKKLLARQIVATRDYLEGAKKVADAYATASDKRLIVLDGPYPCEEFLASQSEPLFVIAPRMENGNWKVNTITVHPRTFESRKRLPAAWAGLRDQELETVTGVSGAIFCHNARFLIVAKTKEAAMALAQKALVESESTN